MLGIGTLLMVAALGSATGSDGTSDDGPLRSVPFSDVVGDQEVVFLLAAAVLFGLVWWLDRAGYLGVATGLVVAALVSAFVGVGEAPSNIDNSGAAVLIFAVGLVVCFVGSHGSRRATTWWGAVLATIGVVAFFASVHDARLHRIHRRDARDQWGPAGCRTRRRPRRPCRSGQQAFA